MTTQEAADNLGWTVDELFARMIADGMVLNHPGGGYLASPHPDIVPLTGIETVVSEPWLCSAVVSNGELTLVSSVLMHDTDAELVEVFRRAEGRELLLDETSQNPEYLFGRARTRVWR